MKFSIITINLNNLQGLKKTCESVISQTWSDFEYIIIDGGSSDGSSEFIKSIEDKISYWVSEKDKGIYHAMNKGIKIANGDFLIFLNSGDYFCNSHVLSNLIIELDINFCFYSDIYLSDEFKVLTVKTYPEFFSDKFMFCNGLNHQSIIYSKKYMSTFDHNLKYISDWLYNYQLYNSNRFVFRKIKNINVVYDFTGLTSKDITKDFATYEKRFIQMNLYPVKWLKYNKITLKKFLELLIIFLRLKQIKYK